MQRWQPDPQRFADEDVVHELEALVAPPQATDGVWAAVRDELAHRWVDPGHRLDDPRSVDVGGAYARHDGDRIVIVSAGQDSMDSMSDVADLLVDAVRRAQLHVTLGWGELRDRPPG